MHRSKFLKIIGANHPKSVALCATQLNALATLNNRRLAIVTFRIAVVDFHSRLLDRPNAIQSILEGLDVRILRHISSLNPRVLDGLAARCVKELELDGTGVLFRTNLDLVNRKIATLGATDNAEGRRHIVELLPHFLVLVADHVRGSHVRESYCAAIVYSRKISKSLK